MGWEGGHNENWEVEERFKGNLMIYLHHDCKMAVFGLNLPET